MSEPVKLVTKPPVADQIQAAGIALLCEALADAEAGKVSGVIIISKETDGSWFHRASGALSVREEIGAIEILKYDRICSTFQEE
jgi:1,4-dihydroxy-2-naphthoyl-CoA synthase